MAFQHTFQPDKNSQVLSVHDNNNKIYLLSCDHTVFYGLHVPELGIGVLSGRLKCDSTGLHTWLYSGIVRLPVIIMGEKENLNELLIRA